MEKAELQKLKISINVRETRKFNCRDGAGDEIEMASHKEGHLALVD
jgi:hypothetical protein